MATVNTNVNATVAQNALAKNERSMNTAMERLSTGKRINGASDDAAGLAISARMTSQIKGLEASVKNANDAISMIKVADGAMVEVGNMLQRMRELTVQAGNGTITTADRSYLSSEYVNLVAEIERIADNTQWNGTISLIKPQLPAALLPIRLVRTADKPSLLISAPLTKPQALHLQYLQVLGQTLPLLRSQLSLMHLRYLGTLMRQLRN